MPRQYPPRVPIGCEMCGQIFEVPPSRLRNPRQATRYCSKPCANRGQGARRPAWNKGLTAATDARVRQSVEALNAYREANPMAGKGEHHWHYGRPTNPEERARLKAARARQTTLTPAQRAALDTGRAKSLELIHHDPAFVAERGRRGGDARRGRQYPERAARMRAYYLANPDKHPHRIHGGQRGIDTNLERAMRTGLESLGIAYEREHPIGRYFADFAILSARVAIETDGLYWHDPVKDAARDADLMALGWHVLHFDDDQVLKHLPECLAVIQQAILQRT